MMKINKDRSTLDELRKMHDLLTMQSMIIDSGEGWAKFLGHSEDIELYALHKDRDSAVLRAFGRKGTKFDVHTHEQREWLIMVTGKVEINFPDTNTRHVLCVSDYVKIEPGEKHSGTFLEDSWMIAVTVPAERAYPDVRGN